MHNIVLANTMRLYRNVDSKNFVKNMDDDELRENLEQLEEIVLNLGYEKVDIDNLSSLKKLELIERGKLDKKFIDRKYKGYYTKDNKPDILINSYNHIELSISSTEKSLDELFNEIYELEEELENHIHFAFDSNFGYLSPNVLNAGTGLSPISLIYLPALNYFGIKEMASGLSRLGYTLGSFRDRSGRAIGSIFTIGFESTFGEEEKSYIEKLKIIINEISDIEMENRKKLYLDNIITLEDMVNRSYGTLANARVISEEEMINSMSNINLGVELSILKPNRDFDFFKEVQNLRNGHLQIERGSILDLKSRDILRANKTRALMREVFR